jgi:hypothetical protein
MYEAGQRQRLPVLMYPSVSVHEPEADSFEHDMNFHSGDIRFWNTGRNTGKIISSVDTEIANNNNNNNNNNDDDNAYDNNNTVVALGGLVVSVLATGPKVAGSNPAEDDGF